MITMQHVWNLPENYETYHIAFGYVKEQQKVQEGGSEVGARDKNKNRMNSTI